ncbi:hypothetical protein RhiirA4_480191 [Rhizophagus irregularis]|uniref:Uncharacterized protein n=1 Tax=Rhizophagus irregularis TaxID=588596 RepID=A0A2I1HHK1_9GLOM|nr:hypothetical protein RhiirA4_480191 [Rhizophagus irregularis]
METSQKDLCTENNTPTGPPKGSKAIVRLYHPCHTYAYSFTTKKLNPYEISDTRGSGTLYNTKKARYFLMELDREADLLLTKKSFFNIYTNDIDMTNDHHRIFNSSSKKINLNYLIVAIKNRLSSESTKNRQTKTFIRFSAGTHVIFLGFYLPCGKNYNFNVGSYCNQPAAFVLSQNRWKCHKHLDLRDLDMLNIQTDSKIYKNISVSHAILNKVHSNHNNEKEVHSTCLGVKYDVTIRRYNEWRGKTNPHLKKIMEPIKGHTKKGIPSNKTYYKEYKNLKFDIVRTPQQIKRWNRLTNSIVKTETKTYGDKPFLIKEDNNRGQYMVFKKIQHLVVRPDLNLYTKDEDEKKFDALIRKRAKNWLRRVKKRNKLKKKLPPLPANFTGDARTYYLNTYNINLFVYKIRRHFDVSDLPHYSHGYLKAKRLYNLYSIRKSRLPEIKHLPQPSTLMNTKHRYEILDKHLNIVNDDNTYFDRITPPPERKKHNSTVLYGPLGRPIKQTRKRTAPPTPGPES